MAKRLATVRRATRQREELRVDIAERLKTIRTKEGYTLTKVSKATSVPLASLWNWENNASCVPADWLYLLCKFYNIPVDTVLEDGTRNGHIRNGRHAADKLMADDNFRKLCKRLLRIPARRRGDVLGVLVNLLELKT